MQLQRSVFLKLAQTASDMCNSLYCTHVEMHVEMSQWHGSIPLSVPSGSTARSRVASSCGNHVHVRHSHWTADVGGADSG